MKFRLNKEFLDSLGPADRKRAEAQIAAYYKEHKSNPLHRFVPHVRQVPYMASRAPYKLFLGGNRSGKTTAGVVDDIVQAIPRKLVPKHLLPYKIWEPPFRCRIIVPDFTQTLQGVMLEKVKEWMPEEAYVGGTFREAYDARDHVLYLEGGSFFQFMTHEQDQSRFQGASLHRVHMDEEMPERLWRENQLRLLDTDGQACFTMTPLSGMSWTYEMFYEPWTKAQSDGWDDEDRSSEKVTVNLPVGETTLVTVDLDENPHLPEAAKRRIIDDPTLSAEERQARKKGRFIAFAGLVYANSWRKDRNIVPGPRPPRIENETIYGGIPDGVDVYVGIDPGLRHMAAVVWLYLDHNDEMVVFDELAIKDQTIADVCKAIHLRNAEWRVMPRWYVIDPASRNRSAQTGRSDQMEYADNGIFAIPGQNAVMTGINRVKARMEAAWRSDAPKDAASLYVSERCDTLLEQLKKYRWAAPSRSEDDPRERVVKKDDHLLDALRYVVMSRPTPPEFIPLPTMEGPLAAMLRADIEAYEQPAGVSHPQGPGIYQ